MNSNMPRTMEASIGDVEVGITPPRGELAASYYHGAWAVWRCCGWISSRPLPQPLSARQLLYCAPSETPPQIQWMLLERYTIHHPSRATAQGRLQGCAKQSAQIIRGLLRRPLTGRKFTSWRVEQSFTPGEFG